MYNLSDYYWHLFYYLRRLEEGGISIFGLGERMRGHISLINSEWQFHIGKCVATE